jgi:EmrB/QacA subfamily drug resistance transporter
VSRVVRPARSWRALALLVASAFFMENLDGTIVVTATQRMARSFRVPAADLNVTIAAYLLALGIFIPVSGWVADRFGARRTFATAIAVFTVSSALCAATSSLDQLTAMRVAQGLGGAMMVPVGRLVVLRATTKSDLINAIAYLTWPALAAPIIAPAVGGALTTYASWRWIFIVNIPLGVAAFAVALRIVPDVRATERVALDWAGFALTATGLAALVGGLELITYGGTAWVVIAVTLCVGAVLLGGAVFHLCRSAHPLLDLGLFRIPTFRVTNSGGSCFRMAIGAAPFLLPLLFQEVFGWNPFEAGLIVVPIFVGNIGVKPFTTWLLRRFGFRTVLVTAGSAVATTLGLCAAFRPGIPLAITVVILFASGISRSIGFTAYNTIVFADVPADEIGNANTLTSTVQQLSAGLGVAAGALALHAGAPIGRLLGVAGRGAEPFTVAFVLIALLALVAAVESAWLPGHAGLVLTGPRPGTGDRG